jgi:hypothetical protein
MPYYTEIPDELIEKFDKGRIPKKSWDVGNPCPNCGDGVIRLFDKGEDRDSEVDILTSKPTKDGRFVLVCSEFGPKQTQCTFSFGLSRTMVV